MKNKKRILLKISGESLMGNSSYGLDVSTTKFIANETSLISAINSSILISKNR